MNESFSRKVVKHGKSGPIITVPHDRTHEFAPGTDVLVIRVDMSTLKRNALISQNKGVVSLDN